MDILNIKSRAEQLHKLCDELDEQAKVVTEQLVDEIVFLEDHLTELKKSPFISINPKNPAQQRVTAAGKQYKEFLQQYNNCIKILLGALGKIEATEESPLRQYLNARRKAQ